MGVDSKLGLFLSCGGSRVSLRERAGGSEETPADHRISWKVLGRLELGSNHLSVLRCL